MTTLRDPFAVPVGRRGPRRPRLAAHVGRTGRARRWLSDREKRVLDVGCSSARGTAAIASARPHDRVVVGVEYEPSNLSNGRHQFPWLTILEGDAMALDLADACADAVLLLDVVEHLRDPARAIAEAHRVLRPDGVLVLSVPHRGPLHWLDALNVYQKLRRRHPDWPPLEAATQSGSGSHMHFRLSELNVLLSPYFIVDRTARTGLGLVEPVYLALLYSRAKGASRVAWVLGWLYVIGYLVEDVFPFGPLGYHLTVRANARPTSRFKASPAAV
jgi:SAM-dependent methyltransferase